jgi:hypothetical protein
LFVILVFSVLFWRTKNGLNPSQDHRRYSILTDPYRSELERKRDGLRLWAGGGWLTLSAGGGATVIFVLIAFPFAILFLGWILGRPLPAGVSSTHVWISFLAFVGLSAAWGFVRARSLRAARALQEELDAVKATDKH